MTISLERDFPRISRIIAHTGHQELVNFRSFVAFGGLSGNVHCSSQAHCKACMGLPIRH